jgi:hypothetical protein
MAYRMPWNHGISQATQEEWEQGRRAPSGAARTLLTIPAKNPRVLREVAWQFVAVVVGAVVLASHRKRDNAPHQRPPRFTTSQEEQVASRDLTPHSNAEDSEQRLRGLSRRARRARMNSKKFAAQLPSLGNEEGKPDATGARDAIDQAITLLLRARDLLASANASRSADRFRRALKSVEGARRNADRFRCRACEGKGRLENPHDLLGTETCRSCGGSGRTQPERGPR